MDKEADELGMSVPITRRDFIGGVSTTAILGSSSTRVAYAQSDRQEPVVSASPLLDLSLVSYPPLRSGLRGQYPGSFEVAHEARDGAFAGPLNAEDTGEHYDLVIVGAGISGLTAAHLYRRALGADRPILVLDNHDDFGGHAKRNEFHQDGKVYMTFGGSQSIETPFPYSYTGKAVLADLGIDPTTYKQYERPLRIKELGLGVFFGREHFLDDRVVPGYGERRVTAVVPFREIPTRSLQTLRIDEAASSAPKARPGRGVPWAWIVKDLDKVGTGPHRT